MAAFTLAQRVQLVCGAYLAWIAGCGDSSVYKLNPSDIDPDTIQPHTCFEGSEIELSRYSSLCEKGSSKRLAEEVDGGVTFEGAATSTLEPPCGDGPSPAVDVSIEGSSLIFDFSNVSGAGSFPDADFDGYLIDVVLRPGNALLLSASVDKELSTLPLLDGDLAFDPDHIEVNFEGIRFDENGLVKIDLLFANVSMIPERDAEE